MSPRQGRPPTVETECDELQATAAMCRYCFDVIVKELNKDNQQQVTKPSHLDLPQSVECPLFVTWDICAPPQSNDNKSSSYQLRGCIGTLSPRPLTMAVLTDYARLAAFGDSRFRPILLHEVPMLRVAVSLLVKYEPCADCYDWTVGVHGIMIKWSSSSSSSSSNNYSATYLPEVASEQGWNQHQAVESLIRKAGYRGEITEKLLQSIKCTRYQSSKHRLTFTEYAQNGGGGNVALNHDVDVTMEGLKSSSCVIS